MSYVLLWANRWLGPTVQKLMCVSRRGLRNEMKNLGERATAAVIALFVKPKSDQPRGPLCLFERLQTELVQAHAADVWSVSEF